MIPEEFLCEVDYFSFESGWFVDFPEDVTVHNPTYAEMKKFIREDKTNQNKHNLEADITDENKFIFGENAYVCHHFAMDLAQNATEKDIRCGYVYLKFLDDFPVGAHAIVCFNTLDQGLIFIESVTDEEVRIVIGESYGGGTIKSFWQQVDNAWSKLLGAEMQPHLVINDVPYFYDDTVKEVCICWNGEASKEK